MLLISEFLFGPWNSYFCVLGYQTTFTKMYHTGIPLQKSFNDFLHFNKIKPQQLNGGNYYDLCFPILQNDSLQGWDGIVDQYSDSMITSPGADIYVFSKAFIFWPAFCFQAKTTHNLHQGRWHYDVCGPRRVKDKPLLPYSKEGREPKSGFSVYMPLLLTVQLQPL